jgi:polar amino acid transport system ATP-binding protein
MDASTEPLIRVRELRKSFESNEVLKNIAIDVHQGEVVSIIGASGSGKSTFLRCLNVLEMPDGGRMQFEDFDFDFEPGARNQPTPADLRHLRARIGMVFQSYNLWPHMTVLENIVEAPIRVKGEPKKRAIERAEALLERIGLADKRDARPTRLSGGQQQRVAIVRALAMAPKLMLFDEVTSALDPELIGEVLMVMQDLARSGQTMLVVSHEMIFVREAAHRVVFMDGGVIVEDGLPAEVLIRPRTDRLRAFLSRFRGVFGPV